MAADEFLCRRASLFFGGTYYPEIATVGLRSGESLRWLRRIAMKSEKCSNMGKTASIRSGEVQQQASSTETNAAPAAIWCSGVADGSDLG